MTKRTAFLLASFLTAWIGIFILLSLLRSTPVLASSKQSTESPRDQSTIRIHPELQKAIHSSELKSQYQVIVEWKRRPDFLSHLSQNHSEDKLSRRVEFVNNLEKEMERQTTELRNYLKQAERRGDATNVRFYWVGPFISLRASPKLIQELALREDIVQIRTDDKIDLEIPQFLPAPQIADGEEYPYNLELIEMENQDAILGFDGSGIVVANVDTGVDWQHPALIKKYRGYNPHGISVHYGNWHVATNEPYMYPGDGIGHGTHTMGTIVGDDEQGNRIGVATGARWIAVKAFNNQGYTYESWIHDSLEWILAPEGNPALAPDIVNNSWGSISSSDERYRQDVAALKAAGILVVFSSGNSGPRPGTVNSPASFTEALAVGSVDEEKVIANSSSRGPSPWDEFKPEVAAPGVNVRSSFPGGGYYLADGTSMAAPHVSGLAALLLQAQPSLTPDELEQIIKSTAEPLGMETPNNDYGWGLINAYQAGLQVTSTGDLSGTVYSASGASIPYPTIVMMLKDIIGYTQIVTISGNLNGVFHTALLPGTYDISASAFGFSEETHFDIVVYTTTHTALDFYLDPLPSAIISGTVLDADSGLPLSATLRIIGTPLSTQTNPSNCAYSMTLPSGTWQFEIEADAHRLKHYTRSVTAGNSYIFNYDLESAPRILLVDSGRWYYNSQISYYQQALETLKYRYSIWPIRSPNGVNGLPDDRPTAADLSYYDLVIWSSPEDSPGLIQANDVLTTYLDTGGNLLISGQDVAYLDGGGPAFYSIQGYLVKKIGIWYQNEGNLNPLYGVITSPLNNLEIHINTPDSAQQQYHPDSAIIRSPIRTSSVLKWGNNEIGGVNSGTCTPYKAAWLGFGLEGAGSESTRIDTFSRLIDWFTQPPIDYQMSAWGSGQGKIALPGRLITETITINNTGIHSDTYQLSLEDETWPSSIQLPDGQTIQDVGTISIDACTSVVVTASISIPQNALRDESSILKLDVKSQNQDQVTDTITISTKTPAPILLVDDELWYQYDYRYKNALQSNHLPYDIYLTDGLNGPPTNTLLMYPVVIWTTGFDWVLPLLAKDESALMRFLDDGRGLLLSSQGLLDVRGINTFSRNYLGVNWASLSITSTLASPAPENPLNLRPRTWDLIFEHFNLSDGLHPTASAIPSINDENAQLIGILNTINPGRSAFFSFPLETLETEAFNDLIGKTTNWLSVFGESQLLTHLSAVQEDQIPLTLTLNIREEQNRNNIKVYVPIPQNTSFVPGSQSGPWEYFPITNSLSWNGDLPPIGNITMTAEIQLDNSWTTGDELTIWAFLHDSAGLATTLKAPVRINTPFLELQKSVSTPIGKPMGNGMFTIRISNSGVLTSHASLKEILPPELDLLTSTLTTTYGTLSQTSQSFTWSALLPPGSQTTIQYSATISMSQRGARIPSRSMVYDEVDQLDIWAWIDVSLSKYFPLIININSSP